MISVRELLERSDTSGSKSTVLKPLTWFISILVAGIILLLQIEAPSWLIILFTTLICIAVILFLFTYLYCLFNDRDALRSESFSIQKMAIEKGLLGDNQIGLIQRSVIKDIKGENVSEQDK